LEWPTWWSIRKQEINTFLNKILLSTLSEKEQQGALLEANLLRQLKHPNIVSYKASFVEKGVLIIVMEYWEVGDLAYHIKKKKEKKERFTEDEILNWFIQIAIALEYIHGRKVIHRDIKTSNIFLTGNGTVKLGDFGISKVLENTNEAAMTVVGTPYYMSPEVCENKPYTFKSDVWALGWVLYELCTLQHAFLADNLLGLVYKIVKGNYESIPDDYSSDLNELVETILNKDESKRPTVQGILLSPFLKAKMEEFISNKGNIGLGDLKARTIRAEPIILEKSEEEKEEDMLKNLTPAERVKKRKELRSKKEAEEMKKAIRKNISNYGTAKERMYNEFYDSKGRVEIKKTFSQETPPHDPSGSSRFNQFKIDPNSMTDFSVNDRSYGGDTFALSNSMGTEISQLTEKQHSSAMGSQKYSSYQDNRVIKSSGKYDYQDEYADDFEEATKNAEEMEDVLENYKRILSGDITLPGAQSLKKPSGGSLSSISEASSTDEIDHGTMSKLRNAREKKMLMDYFGEDLYIDIFNYLTEARKYDYPDLEIKDRMRDFVGSTNKEALSMCFKLDQIVFKELLSS
jgi:serine/threonine protein kinase